MKQVIAGTVAALLAAAPLVAAQGRDASQVLADAQAALGGKKLATLKSLTATGRTLRTGPDGTTRENEFEMSLQLPDKYLLRSVVAPMGNMSVYRHSGFSGDTVIEEIDRPPSLSGGGVIMLRMAGPGGAVDPEKMTPEQKAEFTRTRLASNRRDYVRLALGMFAAAPSFFPLEVTYAGEAESADGKAQALDVKGEGLEARLFVDAETRLPLMLSWMDKEPIVMQVGGPGGGGATVSTGGAHARVIQGGGTAAGMSNEEREKMRADLDERLKEAEANRRTVEFRIFYADYRQVGGVMLPHRIQRSIDGKPAEEMIFDSFKVNPKIDARTFEPINK